MSIGTDLKQYLQSIATDAGQQVYRNHPPQEAQPPFISFNRAAGGAFHETLAGVPLAEAAYHVYAYGETEDAAEQLAEQIRDQLHYFTGIMGGTVVDTVYCDAYGDNDTDKPTDSSYKVRYWARRIYTLVIQK